MTFDQVQDFEVAKLMIPDHEAKIRTLRERVEAFKQKCDHKNPDGSSALRVVGGDEPFEECSLCERVTKSAGGYGS